MGRPHLRILACSAGVALAASGCGGVTEHPAPAAHAHAQQQQQRPAPATRTTLPAVRDTPRPRCLAGAWATTARRAYAGLVKGTATAYVHPGGGAIVGRFGQLDVNRFPTVFAVIGARLDRSCNPAWYHVQLSVTPNGTTGWVPARAVGVYAVKSRVVVDLSTRSLVAYRDGRPVLRARVAVGSPATPTPTGRFFVNESFRLSDPNGPYGVAALGISAHSTVLHEWAQGGPIALHGTNEPGSIGEAVSHGCIRLANDDMQRLLAIAPAGTPVVVRR
jgi:hypothetical protein